MKIKHGFSLTNQHGQYIISCDKSIIKDFTSTIVLTETSAFLWNFLSRGNTTKEQMLHALLDNYDISTVLALNDIDIFIKTLRENGILEE